MPFKQFSLRACSCQGGRPLRGQRGGGGLSALCAHRRGCATAARAAARPTALRDLGCRVQRTAPGGSHGQTSRERAQRSTPCAWIA
eukprot:257091-Pleurochrysis_carterae.AAC.9